MDNKIARGLVGVLLLTAVALSYGQTRFSLRRWSVADGLLSNTVRCIAGDGQGFYWFGTDKGLQQFDGYVFRSVAAEMTDGKTVANFKVFEQRAVGDSCMLFATGIGVLEYSYRSGRLRHLTIGNETGTYEAVQLCPINDSLLLVGTGRLNGLLVYNLNRKQLHRAAGTIGKFFKGYDTWHVLPANNNCAIVAGKKSIYKIHYLNQTIEPFVCGDLPASKNIIRSFLDKQQSLWIVTEQGVYLQAKNRPIERFTALDKYCKLQDQIGTDLVVRSDSSIYISIDWQGIFEINTKTRSIASRINSNTNATAGFTSNAIHRLCCNDPSALWACSTDGVYLMLWNAPGVEFYDFKQFNHPQSAAITRIVQDSHGTVWLASDGGGLYSFSLANRQLVSYYRHNAQSNAPGSNVVVSLYEEKQGKNLWIGCYNGGLSCFNYASKQFRNFTPQNSGIKNNNIWAITEDAKGRLLASSFCESISILDRKTNQWSNATTDNGGISCGCIITLLTDAHGRTWTGSAGCGLDLLDAPKSAKITSGGIAHCLLMDGHFLWVGMEQGLLRFDTEKLCYVAFPGDSLFQDKKVSALCLDQHGRLWIVADNRIYTRNSSTGAVQYSLFTKYFNYSNINSITQTTDGSMLIGGQNGLLVIEPEALERVQVPQLRVSLTELRLFTEAVRPAADAVIQTHCNFIKTLNLPYDHNYVGFSFSTMQLSSLSDVAYWCKLDGLDHQWQGVDAGKNSISYSNLAPGSYCLHIRACSRYNATVFAQRSITIEVLPPLWKTIWFRILATLLLLLCIAVLYWYRIRRLQRRQQILESMVAQRTEQILAQKKELSIQAETLEDQYISLKEKQRELETAIIDLQQSNATKDRLFSIVAHDLRSPFSGVTGIVRLLHTRFDEYGSERKREFIHSAYASLESIQILIDNLLQWTRSQSQHIDIQKKDLVLDNIIHRAARPLMAAIDEKKLLFQNQTNAALRVFADEDTLSATVRNLLQNAIKFTPAYGSITVTTELMDGFICIAVRDTGTGMTAERIEQILQANNRSSQHGTMGERGSGLGLEICKEFMHLNGGRLEIESHVDHGTTVRVFVPAAEQGSAHSNAPASEASTPTPPLSIVLPADTVILVVDDNPLIREHVRSVLGTQLKVLEANNGQTGFEAAREHLPDIVISDVAMPVADGFELCRWLAATSETAHIPVLLLTAKTATESRIEGLSSGAIDYLTKPFNEHELLAKLQSILLLRQKQQEYLLQQLSGKQPSNTGQDALSNPFLQQVIALIEEHLSDQDFHVEQLSESLLMSRATVLRKMKAVVNKSPNDFINEYRLHRAKDLLQTQHYRISEVAYLVGFNDPKYFTRRFKELFGELPSEV